MRLSIATSATVAVLVGFGGTVALVVEAARAVGTDPVQTGSWIAGICLATAVASIVLSSWHKIPIIAAWSTPGAALLAALPAPIGMEAAAGAFVLAAGLILLTALVRPLGDLVARLPTAIAAAMLAGVLLRFVVAVAAAVPASPALVLPLVALFLLVRLVSPMAAVLVVLVAGVALAAALGLMQPIGAGLEPTELALIVPHLSFEVMLGVGLPLYLVTMASQNLPGFAVIRAAGYVPPARSTLAVTGAMALVTAPLGAHTTNLAAITAALCTGPDVHPDPARRWPVGVVYGVLYLLLALFAGSLVGIVTALPVALVTAVAGLALLAPLTGALAAAMEVPGRRLAAVLTLAVTASGVTLGGVGSAFWGLAAGLLALLLDRAAARVRGAA